MGRLIVFYCLFVIYVVIISLYIKKTKIFLRENTKYNKEEIFSEFSLVSRNILYLTSSLLIIAMCLLYKYKASLTPNLVGLSLACLTAAFYIVFVVWDVLQEKIINYFDKRDIHFNKKEIFGLVQVLTIISMSLLLFFISVTTMVMIVTV